MTRRLLAALVCVALAAELRAQAPASPGGLHLRRLLSVPIGALPPQAMLMPASRNHNYLVGRLQVGTQRRTIAGDTWVAGGGLDLQWRGGSAFGLTAGYRGDCSGDNPDCSAHLLFGGRARFNLITGGPTFAALVGDNSATTTVGTEVGIGYSPRGVGTRNACAVDAGLPVSISLFQRIRLLTFFSPGIAWDVRCPRGGDAAAGASTFAGAGIGLQQLGHPGLDVSLGAQRIFRRGAGVQLGLNVTWVRLP